jgi:hypothetical protein
MPVTKSTRSLSRCSSSSPVVATDGHRRYGGAGPGGTGAGRGVPGQRRVARRIRGDDGRRSWSGGA